jgi:hypothetical protein
MTSRKGRPSDYTVGYGRPPKAMQFVRGRSGNPKGRPRGIRPVSAVLQEILEQKIAVTENGASRRIPRLEAMIHRLVNDALRGDSRAVKLLLSLMDRYEASPATKLHLDELLAEDRAILSQYLPELARVGPDAAERADGEGHGNDL